jgi:hypothetical protein
MEETKCNAFENRHRACRPWSRRQAAPYSVTEGSRGDSRAQLDARSQKVFNPHVYKVFLLQKTIEGPHGPKIGPREKIE